MISRALLSAVVAIAAASPLAAQGDAGPWLQYATPAEAGFSAERLARVRQFADSVRSAAVMAVYRGHVIAAFGDVGRELGLHSVRKSLVSALYGEAVGRNALDLDVTLADLGIDDEAGLTAGERAARVRDLLAARSGVFLPAAYAPAEQDETRPARGSHRPGSHFYYNNWDFNVAGVIYERLTGEDLFEAFAARIARPLGMEDWEPADGFDVYEPGLSRHPAQTFRMSARDLARFGQLYLQRGRWAGAQLLPASWIDESFRPHSDFGDGTGYGYMWWTYAPASLPAERYPGLSRLAAYAGRGTGGQAVIVVPGADLVIVHRGDTDAGRHVDGRAVWTIAEGILAARTGEPAARPALRPLAPEPLASQAPAVPLPATVRLDPARRGDYIGRYELAPQAIGRVFEWRDRLFMFVPGRGEAELLATGEDAFTVRVVGGVSVRFERDAQGAVTGVALAEGPRTMRGRRLP